ncbi:hypothetical protein ACM16X_02435 [Haloarcula japonica]|uniref:hypothetical protein n=1 Tax=Haloarcula japonica TaxID=29282 RepID=UPI0039F72FB7
MKLDVLNPVEAEEYASRVLDESDEYGFLVVLDVSHEDPELAYEMVNRQTELKIEGMTEMGQYFDEDRFTFDVIKYQYAQELGDTIKVVEALRNRDYRCRVQLEMRAEADSPGDVVDKIRNHEIWPEIRVDTGESESILRYSPDESPIFQEQGANTELGDMVAEIFQ